jgi:FkbH-like protein
MMSQPRDPRCVDIKAFLLQAGSCGGGGIETGGVICCMGKTQVSFEGIHALGSRREVKAALAASKLVLGLSEAQMLVRRIDCLQSADTQTPPLVPFRLALVHTYTTELLDPWLCLAAALEGLDLQLYHAPYGVLIQEAQRDSGLVAHKPDVTALLLQREDLHPELMLPVSRLSPERQDEVRALVLENIRMMLSRFREHGVGYLVLSFLPTVQSPELGIYDAQSDRSESAWWSRLKADVGALCRESIESSLFLDLDEVLRQVGRSNFFDLRLWYSVRFPFTSQAAREVARRLVSLGAVLKSPKAKVIVLDADNTLWGGVIGEDGIDGIALGPEYPGNAFRDFQRRLLHFQQRGFILALCSKNNPHEVDQVLREHPHQVLREEHFAARRVNWTSKPDNLLALAEELNLGLESLIFVDDSAHECAAVRQRLPQVEVVQTPARPIDIPGCLDHVARLEVLMLTQEDLVKTEAYAQERRRRENRGCLDGEASTQEYLASLRMRMQVSFNKLAHLARLSQMTLKTNQFNLTTRRYDEHQLGELIRAPQYVVADFSLADVFGPSGIVGLAIVRRLDQRRAELDTLLMSCRVIGRLAESAFLHCLLRHLADRGVMEVVADFFPTPKNALVKAFLPDQDFESSSDGRYRRHLDKKPPQPASAFPIEVTVET